MTIPTLRLSRDDIEEILHHAHWIAAKNGAQSRFVHAKYASYSFSGLMTALHEAGCLSRSRTRGDSLAHFSGYRVRRGVTFVEIPAHER